MQDGRVYTIGHGGRTIDECIDQLHNLGILFVIDVRTSPYSRYQPEFSKGHLEEHLKRAGISYGFMGDALGGHPTDPACYTAGKVDYDKCRTKAPFQHGIGRLKHAYEQGYRICLLCSEGKPHQCHRSKLIGAALADEGITCNHILPDGRVLPQDELIRELTGGQGDLFGDHFVSKKTYQKKGD